MGLQWRGPALTEVLEGGAWSRRAGLGAREARVSEGIRGVAEGRLGGEGPSGLRGTLTAGSARWWGRSESWRDGPEREGSGG